VGFDTLDGLVARHLPGRRVALDDVAFLEEILRADARRRARPGGPGVRGLRRDLPQELSLYFTTPVAWVVLVVVAFFSAQFFTGAIDAWRFLARGRPRRRVPGRSSG